MISLTIPTSSAPFELQGFTCREGVSQLFEIVADATAQRSASPSKSAPPPGQGPVAFDSVLGKPATITVQMPEGAKRYFSGIVRSLVQGGGNVAAGPFAQVPYRLEIVPQLWLLTRRAQSRVFQQMTVPDILGKVLQGLDVRYEIAGSYEPRDYCTQYRETDFDFASRLMEEEGIFYFFKHADGAHTLVVGDVSGANPTLPNGSSLRFEMQEGGRKPDDRVHVWEKRQTLTSGKVTLWDHTFELPHKHLDADEQIVQSVQVGAVSHTVRLAGTDKLELYDYPGGYAKRFSGTAPGGGDRAGDVQKILQDNKRTAQVRARQVDAEAVVVHGEGNVRQMVSGHKFTLTNHADGAGDYLVLTVYHRGSLQAATAVAGAPGAGAGELYQNTFTCVPAAVAYRPPRLTPRPTVQGCQTAVVVGPSGEEIFVDKYGRVKVQFHWDRAGKNDANSSCWVRVATSWAGQQWGAVHLPRIGQEVVIDFLEGDPDRPIIVGSVYNAEMMPPYALPANKTQSGIKSRSSQGGTAANFNEIRFEDKKGSEHINVQAEKDLNTLVKHDETRDVGHNRQTSVGNDQAENVGHDETISIGNNRTESVGKDETVSIGQNQTLSVAKDQSIDVGKDRSLTVAKNQTTQIGEALSTTVGKDETHSVSGKRATNIEKDDELQVGKKLLVEAADEIMFKTGDASITMKKDGTISIEGKDVTVNGSGKINVKASSDVVVKGSKVAMN